MENWQSNFGKSNSQNWFDMKLLVKGGKTDCLKLLIILSLSYDLFFLCIQDARGMKGEVTGSSWDPAGYLSS